MFYLADEFQCVCGMVRAFGARLRLLRQRDVAVSSHRVRPMRLSGALLAQVTLADHAEQNGHVTVLLIADNAQSPLGRVTIDAKFRIPASHRATALK